MAGYPLELPTLQNWSCHNCSGCCRQHEIEITGQERLRIEGQGWSEADGIEAGKPVVEPISRLPWQRRYRLAHQRDGACVFLDTNGLCRIHAKFGEAAKPLACRVYPYAFHPHRRKVSVSLRFSCPSVVMNRGTGVAEQIDAIKELVRAVVPAGIEKSAAPRISPKERVDWPDFDRFVERLDATLAESGLPISGRLQRALFWIGLVEQSRFDKVLGKHLDEYLDIVTQAAAEEFPVNTDDAPAPAPSRVGRLQFRMLVAQYARKDTFAEKQAGWRNRWRLLRAAYKFARGFGETPPLQDIFRAVPFAELETPFGGLPSEADEILTRYFRVKIQGLHFCGPAYYGVPLGEGFQSLALVFPSVLFIARWLAAGEGRTSLDVNDVARALAIADHHHGYSPVFGGSGFRRRVRILAQMGDIGRLCAWYSR